MKSAKEFWTLIAGVAAAGVAYLFGLSKAINGIMNWRKKKNVPK